MHLSILMLIGNVSGSRSNGKQVGRFSSWGTVVPYGFLPKSAYFLSHCQERNREKSA